MTRVKVCGLTRVEDALLASELGAWALGFIFYEKSPRFIEPSRVAILTHELEKIDATAFKNILRVGVFVNARPEEILATVEGARLTGVQLHGDETPEFCANLRPKLDKKIILRALRPQTETDLELIPKYEGCDFIITDTFSKDLYGGTGSTSSWRLAKAASQHAMPVILSGGLNVTNVAGAIKAVSPYALDVSSGLEESRGVKSPAKMKEFFKLLRSLK